MLALLSLHVWLCNIKLEFVTLDFSRERLNRLQVRVEILDALRVDLAHLLGSAAKHVWMRKLVELLELHLVGRLHLE